MVGVVDGLRIGVLCGTCSRLFCGCSRGGLDGVPSRTLCEKFDRSDGSVYSVMVESDVGIFGFFVDGPV